MANRFDTTVQPVAQPTNRFDSPTATPLASAPTSAPSTFDRETFKQGITYAENRGALQSGQDPYKVVGVTKDLGKYQVSPTTLSQWSKPWLGKTYTPQQFLADPNAQEEFFNQYMNVAQRLNLTPEQAAATWHKGWGELGTGKPQTVRDAEFKANLPQKVQAAGSYLGNFASAIGSKLGGGQTASALASTTVQPTAQPLAHPAPSSGGFLGTLNRIGTGIGNAVSNELPGLRVMVGKLTGEDTSYYKTLDDKKKYDLTHPEPVVTKDASGKFVVNKKGLDQLQTFVMGSVGGEDLASAADNIAKSIAKTTDESVIRTVLKDTNYPVGGIDEVMPSLVKATTPEDVKAVLKKGVVIGDARATLANTEARLGVKPTEVAPSANPVEDFRAKAEEQLGRPIALTAREKALIRGDVSPSAVTASNVEISSAISRESQVPAELPRTVGESNGQKTSLLDQTQSSLSQGKPDQTTAISTVPETASQHPSLSAEHVLANTSRVMEPTPAGSLEEVARQNGLKNDGRGIGSFKKIIDEYQTPVNKKINFLDYFRTPDRVLEKIGLGTESKYLRAQYEGYLKELPKNLDKVTEWSKEVPKESNAKIFQYLDGKAINLSSVEKKVATEIKTYLSGWADRLGLPNDKRIANYITHIFDSELIKKEFPEDLAKIISDKIPSSVYDPFLQSRLGKLGYKEDTWAALDAYTKRATRKVYMDPALDRIQEKAGSFEESQWNYVKSYLDRVNMRPDWLEKLGDNTLKSIPGIGYKFGDRPTMALGQKARQWVYRGSLGLNFGSAVRNLTQGVNTYAELGEKYTALGYLGLMRNGTAELKDVGVLADDFIQDRTLKAIQTTTQKMDKGLFTLFETAEKINRGAAYYGAKAKALAEGKSLDEAVSFAKDTVRKTQFTFGRIDTPVATQNELVKILTQFQSYNLKQAEFLGEKVVKVARGGVFRTPEARKELAGLARYTLGSVAVLSTIGKLFGMRPQDIIPSLQIGKSPIPTLIADVAKVPLPGQKDQYGNPIGFSKKVKQVGKDLVTVIPGGNQIKKTVQGLGAVSQGKSTTSNGKTQYKIPKTTGNYVRAGLFGKTNLPQAQLYYNKSSSKKKTNRF